MHCQDVLILHQKRNNCMVTAHFAGHQTKGCIFLRNSHIVVYICWALLCWNNIMTHMKLTIEEKLHKNMDKRLLTTSFWMTPSNWTWATVIDTSPYLNVYAAMRQRWFRQYTQTITKTDSLHLSGCRVFCFSFLWGWASKWNICQSRDINLLLKC